MSSRESAAKKLGMRLVKLLQNTACCDAVDRHPDIELTSLDFTDDASVCGRWWCGPPKKLKIVPRGPAAGHAWPGCGTPWRLDRRDFGPANPSLSGQTLAVCKLIFPEDRSAPQKKLKIVPRGPAAGHAWPGCGTPWRLARRDFGPANPSFSGQTLAVCEVIFPEDRSAPQKKLKIVPRGPAAGHAWPGCGTPWRLDRRLVFFFLLFRPRTLHFQGNIYNESPQNAIFAV